MSDIFLKIKMILNKYRPIILVSITAFFIELGYSVVNISTLPIYLTQQLHLVRFLGILLGMQEIFDTISRPFLGALGDKIGRRYLVIAGPIISAVTSAITVHIGLDVLFFLRLLDGIASGALWTSVFAEAGDLSKSKNRNTAMGIVYVGYIAALVVGPLIGGVTEHFWGKHFPIIGEASFIVASFIFIVGSIIALRVFRTKKIKSTKKIFKVFTSFPEFLYLAKRYLKMIVIAFLMFLSIGFLAPLAKVYALQRYGVSALDFGFAIAPVAALLGIASIPLAKFGDKIGVRKSIFYGNLIAVLGSGFIVWSSHLLPAAASSLFMGLGFIILIPSWLALITRVAPKNKKGEVIGIVGFSEGFGSLTGASLSGIFYSLENFQYAPLYLTSQNLPFFSAFLVLMLVAVLTYFWVYRPNNLLVEVKKTQNSQTDSL